MVFVVPVGTDELPNGNQWVWVECPDGERYLLIDGRADGFEVPDTIAAALAARI